MISEQLRLVRLAGLRKDREWTLKASETYRVGRSQGATRPEVDLAPDPRVSRQHAKIWFDHGWKVEDLGSRHGSLVSGTSLRAGEPRDLHVGDEIQLGESRLLLLEPGVACLQNGPILLEVGVRRSIGYAHSAARRSALTLLRIRNASSRARSVDSLRVSIEGLGQEEIPPRTLAPQESQRLELPLFLSAASALNAQPEKSWRRVRAELNGQELEQPDFGLWCLAANEWCYEPEWHSMLASFVLPNHSAVTRLAADVAAKARGGSHEIPRLLFETLSSEWRLEYQLEAPNYETDTQKVRLPEQLLWDETARVGGGTCLDLALLMAGVLECAGLDPLIAIVELDDTRHALVGHWNAPGARLEPTVTGADRLAAQATWFDPNACTSHPSHRADFEVAKRAAHALLETRPLLFALDVLAARQDGFRPMPRSQDPQLSPDVARIVVEAQGAARGAGASLGTVPLLIGVLRHAGRATSAVLGPALAEAQSRIEGLSAGLRPANSTTQPSRRYFEVLSAATARAKSSGASVVTEANLLAALLATDSEALDRALRWLGVQRSELRDRLGTLASSESEASSIFDAPRSD